MTQKTQPSEQSRKNTNIFTTIFAQRNESMQKAFNKAKINAEILKHARYINDQKIIYLLSTNNNPKVRQRVVLNKNTTNKLLSEIIASDPSNKIRLLARKTLKHRVNEKQKEILRIHLRKH